MPFEAFIQIEGVPSPDGDAGQGDIEMLSFHWGVSQLGPRRENGEPGASAAHVQDFSFVKRMDATSPLLFLKCCMGEIIPTATCVMRQIGGEPGRQLRYRFSDVVIAAVRPGGAAHAADDFPIEEVSLAFARCELDYWLGKADERLPDNRVHAAWTLRQATAT